MKHEKFDFVVGGAGLSGMIAAVAAARRGMKVALINDRGVLGGNASSEIGVVIQGSSHHGLNSSVYAKETGIVDELRQTLDYALKYRGYGRYAAADAVFFDFIYNEKNISLYLNTVITDVETSNGAIKAVHAYVMKQDEKICFSAPLFADCTGDAVIAHKAGAACMMGSESKAEFGEPSAPEEKETYTMGNTLYFEIEDTGSKVEFTRPSFAHDISKMDFINDIDNPSKFRMLYVGGRFWTLEYGGQVNTISDNEHINLELRKLVFGIWDYIKNSGRFPKADTFKIKRVYTTAGTRESRRVVGDYILTENDITEKRSFEDNAAIGGWPMDIHAPKGIYDDLPASAFIPVTGIYNIPFRCLYSRDIDNLMLAGRDISATHIAMSSTRVMATCGAMGQAVGTAAYLCKKYRCKPRGIYSEHICELKDLLKEDDQTIIGERTSVKPALEKQFKVSASSQCVYQNTRHDSFKKLDFSYGLALPVISDRLESLKIKLQNHSHKAQKLRVKILTGKNPEAYLPDKLISEQEIDIAPGFYGWQSVNIGASAGADGKIYIVFDENSSISLSVSDERTPGAVSFRYYRERTNGYNHNTCPIDTETGFIGQDIENFNIAFCDIVPEQDIFSANNLLGGFGRPHGHMNMWLSDFSAPQTVILSSDGYNTVGELQLLFDNDLDIDTRGYIAPALVRDYDVYISARSGQKVISVRDNFQRLNRLKICDDVNEIKIEFLRTYGKSTIGLYGIKLL